MQNYPVISKYIKQYSTYNFPLKGNIYMSYVFIKGLKQLLIDPKLIEYRSNKRQKKYLLKEWHRVTQENQDQEFSLSVDLCVSRTQDVCIITFVILLKTHALKTWRVYRHVKSFCWQCLTQTPRFVKLQSKYIFISAVTCKYDLCCKGHSALRLLSLKFFQIPPKSKSQKSTISIISLSCAAIFSIDSLSGFEKD